MLNLAHSLYSAAVKTAGFGLTSPPFAWGNTSNSAAGPFIDENAALNLSAVFNATEIISNAIMVMPLMTYQRLDEQGKELRRDHPVFDILHRRPNPHMHAARWKSLMMVWKLLWGNARSEIERNRAGQVINLWPIHPSRAHTFKDDRGRKWHRVWNEDGTQTELHDSRVVHWMGMSTDGLNGLSRVRMGAASMGLSVAQETFAARFFKNNAMPGLAVTHPKRLSNKAKENLRESWVATYGGDKVGSPAILEEGVDVKVFQMPNTEAQFLESRLFSILEIARWFNISPHKLKELSRMTFNNVIQLALEFVGDTIMPHAVENETETTRKLFSEKDQLDGFFCEFMMDSLLRADALARNKSLAIKKLNGVYNTNEWRAKDNEAPIPDEDGGSDYWRPKNMMVVGSAEDVKPSGVVFPAQQNTDDALAAHETLLTNAIERVNLNASKVIDRAAKSNKQPDYIRLQTKFVDAVTPILESLARCVCGSRPDMLLQCHTVILKAAESYLRDGDTVDHAAIIMEQVRDCLCEATTIG